MDEEAVDSTCNVLINEESVAKPIQSLSTSDTPPASTPAKRGRGKPTKPTSDSECSVQSGTSSKNSIRKRKTPAKKAKEPWTLEDKQKFVTSMSHIDEFRKTDGNMNWPSLAKSIGKTVKEVKD